MEEPCVPGTPIEAAVLSSIIQRLSAMAHAVCMDPGTALNDCELRKAYEEAMENGHIGATLKRMPNTAAKLAAL